MKITASNLIRWTGLSAMGAGIIFAGIQPIHPPDALSSVTTSAWAIITPLKTAMCLFFLLGITGIYARQLKEAGWLGLAGVLLLSLSWALNLAFIFAEAFILPLLATTAPTFVEGVLGIFNGHPVETNLGALPALFALTGVLYMLGGLVFWHRDATGRHPAAPGGRTACRRGRVDPVGCAGPARAPAVSRDAGGGSSGVPGLCALV